MLTVCIIGGGPSGVCALAQLVEQLIQASINNVNIIVFDKSEIMGPGLAYKTDLKMYMDPYNHQPIRLWPFRYIRSLTDRVNRF